jgi:hypothetical protein
MRRRDTTLVIATLCVLALCAGEAPAQTRGPTPDLTLTVCQGTDAQISPDGARVILQVSRPRAAGDKPGAAIQEL